MVCGVHDEVCTYHHSQFQTSRETPPPLAIIPFPVTLLPWYRGEDVSILGCPYKEMIYDSSLHLASFN